MIAVWANGFGIFYLKSAAGTDPDCFDVFVVGLIGIVVVVVDVEHFLFLFFPFLLYRHYTVPTLEVNENLSYNIVRFLMSK